MNAHNPPAGSNVALTREERHALRMHYAGKLSLLEDRSKAIGDEKKALRKQAKADGFVLKDDIDFALKALRAEDDATIGDSLGRMLDVATMMKLPIGYQMDIFLDKQPAFGAYEAGHRVGAAARDRESPYAANSQETTDWLRGYDDAQKEAQGALKRAMELRNALVDGGAAPAAEAKKRGRPRKVAGPAPIPENTSGHIAG